MNQELRLAEALVAFFAGQAEQLEAIGEAHAKHLLWKAKRAEERRQRKKAERAENVARARYEKCWCHGYGPGMCDRAPHWEDRFKM